MTPRAVEWKLLLIIGKKPDYDDDRVPCNYDQQILEPSPLFCLDPSFLLLLVFREEFHLLWLLQRATKAALDLMLHCCALHRLPQPPSPSLLLLC